MALDKFCASVFEDGDLVGDAHLQLRTDVVDGELNGLEVSLAAGHQRADGELHGTFQDVVSLRIALEVHLVRVQVSEGLNDELIIAISMNSKQKFVRITMTECTDLRAGVSNEELMIVLCMNPKLRLLEFRG